jgi:hypothetical protein
MGEPMSWNDLKYKALSDAIDTIFSDDTLEEWFDRWFEPVFQYGYSPYTTSGDQTGWAMRKKPKETK